MDPGRTDVPEEPGAGARRLARAYLEVALHAGFRAYALPSALTYGAIFVFIAGSSFAYMDVLGVSSARYGVLFSLGVSGYLLGTVVCRALRRVVLEAPGVRFDGVKRLRIRRAHASLGAAGRERVLGKFTWRRTAEGMLDNWYAMLDARGAQA